MDSEDEVFTADNAADMAAQLIELMDEEPDTETLAQLAAAVLGCDVLDVVITHTPDPQFHHRHPFAPKHE